MKTVLAYSGGLDSTVLMHDLANQDDEILALSFDYGQWHRRELDCARKNCYSLAVAHRTADIRPIKSFLAGSSQTSHDIEVPEGQYRDESMRLTTVPNLNMIMLSIAAGWAVSREYDRVAFAARAVDHPTFPDCREAFLAAMRLAFGLANWHKVGLHAPYVNMTKAQIVKRGYNLGAPLELSWSCYKGGEKHCGRCGNCMERRIAFKAAGIGDPTIYEPPPEASGLGTGPPMRP